jgi:DnaJ-class molecular chaperone|tara:strand:+ start:3037 stop:3252 length:216 start_codon:yes stop_codon:yes gene_type:complete
MKLIQECEVCKGEGKSEKTVGGVDSNGPWFEFREQECEECDGTGELSWEDDYESEEEAREAYPELKRIEHS